jgi:hypothetical protein
MIVNFLFIWLVGAVAVSLYNVKYGVALIIAYLLLVPYSSFTDAIVAIEFNYIVVLIFGIFIVKSFVLNKEPFDPALARTFGIFIAVLFAGSIFSELAFNIKVTHLYRFVLFNCLTPVILWHSIKDQRDVYMFAWIILVCFFIMSLYGIYCFISQSNPYVVLMSVLFNKDNNFDVFADSVRGGLEGRVQSTTFHPFFWSVSLVMMMYFSYLVLRDRMRIVQFVTLGLLSFNLLICGVRTGIVAFFIGVTVVMFRSINMVKATMVFLLFFVVAQNIDTTIFGQYQGFAESIIYIFDSDKNIKGSSIELRLDQLGGAIELWINGGVVFGNGFGWCDNYYGTRGDHPILLGFESLLYKIIIDSGIVGIIIWSWLFYSFYRMADRINSTSNSKKIFMGFLISFIVFVLATGIFGMNLFLILLVLFYKFLEFEGAGKPHTLTLSAAHD